MSDPKYVVITPTRDEEQYLPGAILSMVAQSIKPYKWIIVDDGSLDETGTIADAAAAQYAWITAIHRENRGSRQAGSGVIEAFYSGYALAAEEIWDYVVKLDADLQFESDYFENCFREFQADPLLGIAGGLCCIKLNQTLIPEFNNEPLFHVRGPTKIYRRACFLAIGGLTPAPGWDTIDQLTANMLGWKTKTLASVRLRHCRPTGGAYGSWNNWVKNGLANYVTGYHPLFMILKCARRTIRSPHWGGIGLLVGFLKGYVMGIPQTSNLAVIRYVRSQQMKALFFQPSLWRERK